MQVFLPQDAGPWKNFPQARRVLEQHPDPLLSCCAYPYACGFSASRLALKYCQKIINI
jgi:hypothetical protein